MRARLQFARRLVPAVLAWMVLAGFPSRSLAVDYPTELKPLFRDRCFSCHGALKQKADLRLDTVALMLKGGKSGPVVVAGDPGASPILSRVRTEDVEERMPPEHEGQPFSSAQVALLQAWIAAGAPAPKDEQPEPDPREHWAFKLPRRPSPPAHAGPRADWVRNPIDAFVAEGHARRDLQPAAEPPRPILIRRLYLDLVGVPPTGPEIDALVRDPASDWYERLVDRLLDDPRHGERWARHWMDIWRYSDGWGLGEQHRNSQKHIWHWRDWIVESLNRDLGYDEMIRLMLAADELHPTDTDRLRATGFLARNYFLFNRNQWLDETVEHVAKGFLGLTLNCSKCHDHKYDPLPQQDYYRMRAFFEPYHVRLDVLPGEPDLDRNGLPRAYDRDLDTPTYRFIRGQEAQPDKSVSIPPGVPAALGLPQPDIQSVSLPAEAWDPARRAWVVEAHIESALRRAYGARAKREAMSDPGGDAVAVAEVNGAEAQALLAEAELESVRQRVAAMRADWSSGPDADIRREAAVRWLRRVEAARARVAVADLELKRLRETDEKKRAERLKEVESARTKLADAKKALEASVKPGEEFPRLAGAAWVATRFLDSTKDDPAKEFPRTSSGRRTALAAWITDRGNPLTARVAVNHLWNRHFGSPLVPTVFDLGRKGTAPTHPGLLDWLACELMENGWSLKRMHRLLVTSATYRMGSSVAGSEGALAADPDNRWWWRRVPIRLEAQVVRDSILAHAGRLDCSVGGPSVPAAAQRESLRRSVYFYHSNNDRNLFLTTFDDALVKECYRREQSIVPQQALALLNSGLVHENSARIAARLGALPGAGDDAGFVREAFRVLLGFEPSKAEAAATLGAMAEWSLKIEASNSELPGPARANLVWALLNHGDFVTVR